MSEQVVELIFGLMEPRLRRMADALNVDGDEVLRVARTELSMIATDLAYGDNPRHPMAMPLFGCAVLLAMFKAARPQVDAHAFGRAFLDDLAIQPMPSADNDGIRALAEAGAASLVNAKVGEFVFEVEIGEPGGDY